MTMLIREAHPADWPGIWTLMEPIIRAGETYTFARDTSEEAMRAQWLSAPSSELAETATPSGHDGVRTFRGSRTFVVAEETGGLSAPMIVATAQLHPNFPGAGSHVANASFMVHVDHAGKGYGRLLGHHVLNAAFADGYHAMVFNAVVQSNIGAVHLWQSLGFSILTTIPEAFDHPVHGLVGMHVMHRPLAP